MPEMLTIAQAAERIKRIYPDTTIGEKTLRKWQKDKRFHSVTVGRKILLSWESVCSFLSGEPVER